eukprot:764856-Hanusia_phi.AAC.5
MAQGEQGGEEERRKRYAGGEGEDDEDAGASEAHEERKTTTKQEERSGQARHTSLELERCRTHRKVTRRRSQTRRPKEPLDREKDK